MESSNNEEKEAAFREMLRQYSEMGEAVYKLYCELGYEREEDKKLRNEFGSILEPAGFFVWGIDAIKHPMREVYEIRVCRKLPVEMEIGKAEPIPVF